MVGCGTPQGRPGSSSDEAKSTVPTETPTSEPSSNLILRDYSMDFNKRQNGCFR